MSDAEHYLVIPDDAFFVLISRPHITLESFLYFDWYATVVAEKNKTVIELTSMPVQR
jgi:hypothetical protein